MITGSSCQWVDASEPEHGGRARRGVHKQLEPGIVWIAFHRRFPPLSVTDDDQVFTDALYGQEDVGWKMLANCPPDTPSALPPT